MKQFLLSSVFLLFGFSASFCQIYRAQEYNTDKDDAARSAASRWEISAALQASTLEMRDFVGQKLTQGEIGASVRMLYFVAPWIALGAEGAFASAGKRDDLLDIYKSYRLEGLSKLSLTPNTSPRSYLVLGGGVSYREVAYLNVWDEKASLPYLMFGWGLETDICGNWFGGLELRGVYHLKDIQSDYFYLPHRWEGQMQLRVGLRF